MHDTTLIAALTCAAQSDYEKHRIGCCISDKKGNIVSVGYNTRKTHPMQYKIQKKYGNEKRIYLHAEISAIARATKSTLLPYNAAIIRINKHGLIRMARPCYPCMMALSQAGVREVHYSNDLGEIKHESL